VKALGVPHSELNMTLCLGWYQKSYPNFVASSDQVPFTFRQTHGTSEQSKREWPVGLVHASMGWWVCRRWESCTWLIIIRAWGMVTAIALMHQSRALKDEFRVLKDQFRMLTS